MNLIRTKNMFAVLLFSLLGFHTTRQNDCVFSSKIDPEEIYSVGKALGDIGVFPDAPYNGFGIKVGIIDNGFPDDLTPFEQIQYTFGSRTNEHSKIVREVIKTVAPNVTFYYAAKDPNTTFAQCLNWLVNVAHVDVINHSAAFLDDLKGSYYYSNSRYIDSYISTNNLIFVNSLGNIQFPDTKIPGIALGINPISVGASDKERQFSTRINAYSTINNILTIVNKPDCIAPGESLYGFDFNDFDLDDSILNDSDLLYDNVFSGTSFSAPFVTGIISLLLQEFPSLKSKPQSIHSLIEASKRENGLIDYQLARQCAKKYFNYNIPLNADDGDLLLSENVIVPTYGKISIGNFILFNDLYNHIDQVGQGSSNEPPVPLSEIRFSKIKVEIKDSYSNVLDSCISTFSSLDYSFTNTTASNNLTISVCLYGDKAPVGVEKACFCYRVGDETDLFEVYEYDYYLDKVPLFSLFNNLQNYNSASLIFYNFRNQIVLTKYDLDMDNEICLTKAEWDSLVSLRGREYYMYLKVLDSQNKPHYSKMYCMLEPKLFATLSNINPSEFGFPDSYNASEIVTNMYVEGTSLTIKRLRCGYIQEQYVNLSSKKLSAGHAYLQIEFNRYIRYCAFGVTLWRENELNPYAGDTAVVEYLNSNGQWIELLDLLNDIELPSSRKDILRFEVNNIYGIRFDATSDPLGIRNKGRLCIDNISFTPNQYYLDYLCNYYEPIVVRESFETPS